MHPKNASGVSERDFSISWSTSSKEKRWKEFKRQVCICVLGFSIFAFGAVYVLIALKLACTP